MDVSQKQISLIRDRGFSVKEEDDLVIVEDKGKPIIGAMKDSYGLVVHWANGDQGLDTLENFLANGIL